jgi:hypothetical protein
MVDRRRLRTDPGITILDACTDPNLFGPQFRNRASWQAWFAFLAGLFALPMTEEQLARYRQHTGRSTAPTEPLHEAWLVCGRRAGKSFILALIATYLACFRDWRSHLAAGEVGTVMIIAADRRQARVCKRYCLGLLKSVPMLRQLIEAETRESITLRNRIVIEVHTASFRTTRGYSIVAALLDELAFWNTSETSAEPDVEVINAIRPSMATVPGAMLLCASSPHARRGALWDAFRRHHGKDGNPVLVWQAATRDMNPSVPQAYIDSHLEDDPARASAEYLAQFRTDVEGFVTREAALACVSQNIYERAPLRNLTYTGFVDPSGGSSDSMTLAIGHFDYASQMVIVDALREAKPPFSPEYVVSEFCQLLKSYRCWRVIGDRYAGEWPREQFSRFGIIYEPAPKPKSELYLDTLALLNSKRIDLLDHAKAFNQLLSLERRSVRGGRDSIDHPPGQHDDCINAIAGLASTLIGKSAYNVDALADPNYGADVLPIETYRRRRHPQFEDSEFERVRQPIGRLA